MKKRFKILLIALSSLLIIFILANLVMYGVTLKTERDFEESISKNGFSQTLNKMFPLTDEELDDLVPYNKEKEEKLITLPSYNANDTWDIYIYMCGSDLESSFYDNLSDLTSLNLSLYASNNTESYSKQIEQLQEVQTTLYKNNMDFPSSFYDPLPPLPESEDEGDYDSNAKGSASEDLRAITSSPLTPNVRFIIQTGGSKKWDYPGVNPNRIQRFIYDYKGLREVYNGPLENMGSTEGLNSFLSFISEYDATHKFFIFWDHGEGAFGAEHDELFNDKLYLSEIRTSFSSFYDLSTDNPPFELLGFDACLMGNAEACYYLQGLSKYYVASEDIEFGGWNYGEWISKLCENPGINGAMLGKYITDSFIKLSTQQYLVYEDEEVPNTLCVYDLEKASKVYEQYNALMEKALIDSLNDPHILSILSKASSSSIRYSASDYETFNTCDLSSFMENLKPYYEKEANNIISLIDEATLYSRGRGHNKYSNGMSIYFPTTIKTLSSLMQALDYIENVAVTPSLKALYYYKSVGCLNDEGNEYLEGLGYPPAPPLFTTDLSVIGKSEVSFDNDTFSITLPENLIKYINSARLITAKYDEKEDSIKYLEELPLEVKDNTITAPLNPRSLYLDIEPLSIEYMYKTNDIERYKSPILINGKSSSIVIDHNITDDSIVISGVKDESLPSDIYGRVLKTVNRGDTITPLYYTESGFYLEESYEKGNEIKYKNTPLVFNDRVDGEYLLCIEVRDLRGNVYSSPVVETSVFSRKIRDVFVNDCVQTF